ncbi:hypothetical protein OZ722_000302 [Yersinia enterocolitica]|nr:hypothetical protein [Yersinia enterocolitica]
MSEIKQYDTEVRLEAVMGTNHYGVHIHAMTAENLHSKSGIAVELAWRDLRIEQLIAQLEATQKERDVYAKLASDVGDIITLLQNNGWAEHIGKTNVGGLLEYQITRLMNSIAYINTKLLAAEAALSAANEKLKGERVPVGWEVCSPEWCNKHNACHEAPRIWFASEDGTGPHYHPSDFTAPQKPVVFHPANDIANIGDNRQLWHQRDLMWQSAIKAAGFSVKEDATPPPSLSSLRPLE